MIEEVVEKDLVDKVNLGASIRFDLNQIEWKAMNKIQTILREILDEDHQTIRALNDCYHYKDGGYPNPDSPPRSENAVDRLAKMFKYVNMLGDGEMINTYMRQKYGMEIVVVNKDQNQLLALNLEKEKKLNKLQADLGTDVDFSARPIEVVRQFVQIMDAQQGVICRKSNSIKNDLFGELDLIHPKKVKKGDFLTSVSMAAQELKKADSGKKAKAKLIEKNEILQEVLDVTVN